MLAERLQLQAKPRVLEIGACCNPMMCGLCEDLHCIDIDMQTLQVGHLIAEQKNLPVRYICADGGKLPYREQSFDWIIMFSTLHHFADPGQVLGNLKRYLKPQGRIAVMCEPLGQYIDGDIYEELSAHWMTLYSETSTSSSGFLMSKITLCNCPGVNSNLPRSAYSSFTGMPSSRPTSKVS